MHFIRGDKCFGGKGEDRLVLRRPRPQPAAVADDLGVHSLPKSRVPSPAHTAASSRAQEGTAPRHPQLLHMGVPRHPLPHPCTVPDTDRRLTLPEDFTVLQEKGFLNLFHESLLKTSLELTVPKARNPDGGPYKRGAALPP